MGCAALLMFVFFGLFAGTMSGFATTSETTTIASEDAYAGIPFARTEDGGFVLGNPDAPVTIVEFGDFACPHCQNYYTTSKEFIEDFVATGQAKFEYRMFISGAEPVYGTYTAQLAECADEQQEGGFWPAHDVLFELGQAGRFGEQTARQLAERLELDYAELLDCAGDADQYETDVNFGYSLGVNATPTIMMRVGDEEPQFITFNDQTFDGGPVPYEVLEAIVFAAQGGA